MCSPQKIKAREIFYQSTITIRPPAAMEREVGAGGNQIYRLGYQYQAYLLAHIVRGQQEELRAGTPFLGLSAKWDFL